MTGHHNADSWRAHVDRRLDEIRAALLDLIDAGVPDAPAQARPPSKREQAATDRADGDFRPSVRTVSARTAGDITYGDPTGGDVLAWEAEVQDATTRLYAAVTVAHEVADGLGLTPTDEHGRTIAAPVEPPTRRTLTDRLIVDASPRDCRRAAIAGVTYVGAVADQVADRMVAAEGDVAEAVDSRARWLEAAVGQLAFRLAPPPPLPALAAVTAEETRPCQCDRDDICPHEPGECGNDVKVATRALACGTCRNRATAARKAAS